jgi:hypothetical protein
VGSFVDGFLELQLFKNKVLMSWCYDSRMRWAGHVAGMGEKRNAYRILVRKPEGKRPLGRQRRRWVDNIKMDLREIGWGGMDWIELVKIGTIRFWEVLN